MCILVVQVRFKERRLLAVLAFHIAHSAALVERTDKHVSRNPQVLLPVGLERNQPEPARPDHFVPMIDKSLEASLSACMNSGSRKILQASMLNVPGFLGAASCPWSLQRAKSLISWLQARSLVVNLHLTSFAHFLPFCSHAHLKLFRRPKLPGCR